MPRKPGVSKVRATAPRSNSAPCGVLSSWSAFHRMIATIERVFDQIKHVFDRRPWLTSRADRRENPTGPAQPLVTLLPGPASLPAPPPVPSALVIPSAPRGARPDGGFRPAETAPAMITASRQR